MVWRVGKNRAGGQREVVALRHGQRDVAGRPLDALARPLLSFGDLAIDHIGDVEAHGLAVLGLPGRRR